MRLLSLVSRRVAVITGLALGSGVVVSVACSQGGALPELTGSSQQALNTPPSTTADADPSASQLWTNRQLHQPPPLSTQADVPAFVTWAMRSVRAERPDAYNSLARVTDQTGVANGLIAEVNTYETADNGRALVAMSLLGALRSAAGAAFMKAYLLLPLPSNGLMLNGDFETANLSSWTASGASETISQSSHSGTYSAMLGLTTATNGDSTVKQAFTVPTTGGTVSFWYSLTCPDTLTYDWFVAELQNASGTVLATIVPKTCVASSGWTRVIFDLSAFAGQVVVLATTSHDDNYGADPTYTLVDDVSVAAAVGDAGGEDWHLYTKSGFREQLQIAAASGLGFMLTADADSAVLNAVAKSPSISVRSEAVLTYLYNRGDNVDRRRLLSQYIRPGEAILMDRVVRQPEDSNATFDAKLSAFLALHPEVMPPNYTFSLDGSVEAGPIEDSGLPAW